MGKEDSPVRQNDGKFSPYIKNIPPLADLSSLDAKALVAQCDSLVNLLSSPVMPMNLSGDMSFDGFYKMLKREYLEVERKSYGREPFYKCSEEKKITTYTPRYSAKERNSLTITKTDNGKPIEETIMYFDGKNYLVEISQEAGNKKTHTEVIYTQENSFSKKIPVTIVQETIGKDGKRKQTKLDLVEKTFVSDESLEPEKTQAIPEVQKIYDPKIDLPEKDNDELIGYTDETDSEKTLEEDILSQGNITSPEDEFLPETALVFPETFLPLNNLYREISEEDIPVLKERLSKPFQPVSKKEIKMKLYQKKIATHSLQEWLRKFRFSISQT